ncbi:hypothetical protein OAD26_00120, partial [bacterium]|nr:hypothetical protein [bacterium]
MKKILQKTRINNKITLFRALLLKLWRFGSVSERKVVQSPNAGLPGVKIHSLFKSKFVAFISYGLLPICVLLLVSVAESKVEMTRKTDTLHVFPGAVQSTDWTNEFSIFIQDVSEDAIYQSFDEDNSAYLFDETALEIVTEPTVTPSAVVETSDPESVQTPVDETVVPDTETPASIDTSTVEEIVVPVEETEPLAEEPVPEPIEPEEVVQPVEPAPAVDEPVDEPVVPAEETALFGGAKETLITFFTKVTEALPFVQETISTPLPVEEEIIPVAEEEAPVDDPIITNESDEVLTDTTEVVPIEEAPIVTEPVVEEVSSEVTTLSVDGSAPAEPEVPALLPEKTRHEISFSNFAIPEFVSGQFITNMQLRMSFAAKHFDLSSTSLPTLDVEYRFGSEWESAGVVLLEEEVSNALNGGYFLFALPAVVDASMLEELEVRVVYQGETEKLEGMFLDSLWLEVDTETFDRNLLNERIRQIADGRLKTASMHELIDTRLDFMRTENPKFTLRYNSQRNAAVRFFRNLFGKDLARIDMLEVKHKGVGLVGVAPQIDMTDDGLWTIQLTDEDRKKLRPGEYTIELTIAEGGKTFMDSFNFQWGMLAVNPDQTEYQTGDIATISLGALTPSGNTLCDADLQLYIIDPNEFMHRVPVIQSGLCDGNNVIDVPDYSANFVPEKVGVYEMYVERLDGSGEVLSHTSDTFEVVHKHDVSLRRNGPTRIYPPAFYPMEITISAERSFTGTLTERVPGDFIITDTDADVTKNGDVYELTWDFDLLGGREKTFSYTFDAPDLSPFLYELGPATLTEASGRGSVATGSPAQNQKKTDFTEHRKWQIASDATGNMVLLWDGTEASIPAGWTCISCTGGDALYQQFVVGDSTYNSSTGTLTHTPTVTASVETTLTAATNQNGNGTVVSDQAHTHTLTPTVGSANNTPLYRNLLYIQYTTAAGDPTTIPAGAIGIFDVASSSLPTDWTRFEAQDGYYVRGEGTSGGTGGSNTHTHSLTGTTGAAAGTTYRAQGGTTVPGASAGHTHTINSSTVEINSEPPYIEVLLAELGTDSSVIPNGLIAMWTDEVPTSWEDISSESGDPFNERFIKASTTYGTTGGSVTHTHADVNDITTSAPSATSQSRTGTAGAAGAHVHLVDVTNFSTSNNLPPAKSIVFGKRQGNTIVFTQLDYRWYVNEDSQTPTDPWPTGGTNLEENEWITATSTTVADGDVVRLRISALVENATTSSSTAVRLQYAAGSDCSAVGSWTNVGASTSSVIWRGYDNGSVTDHSTLSSTTLSSTTVAETYEENGYSTTTQNDIGPDEVGEWDFVIEHNGAASSTEYCFRITEEDGTPFTTYANYPKLLTNQAPEPPTLSKLFDNEKTASTTPWFEFVTTDPEGEDVSYQIQIDNNYNFGSAEIDKNTISHGTQFENLVTASDKDAYNDGELMRFTAQTALTNGDVYYWRVRAKDPDGSNDWGMWSEIRSFTVDTGLTVSAWHQTDDEQFDTNTLVGLESGGDDIEFISGSTTGSMKSTAINFTDGSIGTAWGEFSFNETDPSGVINYQIEYYDSGWSLVPDVDLSGNSTGFTATTSLVDLDVDTYGTIRLVANFTGTAGTPKVLDWTVEWGYRIDTPTITKLFPNEKVGTTTPVFEFTTTDPQDDDLTYEIEWSVNYDFTAAVTRISSSSAGFLNIDNGVDTDPFNSGDTVQFTVQGADELLNNTTYWWRVRATDPLGTDAFSFWTEPRSFTVDTTVEVSTWFQTTEEQFDTDILSGTYSLSSDALAVATTATEVMLVYGEGIETEPRYRQWNGSSWGTEGTLGDVGSPLKWAVVEAASTREEYVAATVGTDGDVHVHVFSTGVWGNQLELTTTMGDVNARGFDVTYETLSGDAVVAYCDGDADPSYYVWDGSSWTSGGTINLTTTQNCEWIQLASDPVSDEIIVLSRPDDGSTYEAQVWSGSTWGNSTTQGTVAEADHEGMAVEYEESGGQALIVTSDGNPGRFRWNSWDGTTWGTAATVGLGDDFEWGELVADVGSDELALCYMDEDLDVGTVIWSGTAWGTFSEHTADGNAKNDPPFSCVYETNGARDNYVMTAYSDTASTYFASTSDSGTTWDTGTQINSFTDAATMELERSGDGTILGLVFDDANDRLLFSSWNGSTWSATTTLETNMSVDATPFGKPYNLSPRRANKSGTTIVSPGINFSDGLGPYWQEMSWVDTTPGTSDILYSMQYYSTASSSWEFIPDSEIPGNAAGTTTSPIDLSGLNVGTYNLIRPYATLSCDGSDNCPTLQDWTVEWAGGITVSGTLQAFDQSTNINSGTVAVAVNGVLQTGKTGTVAGGAWSISNVTTFPGDVVTVFVNGAGPTAEAVGVTRYDGFGDITGLQMYELHLTLGSDDATSTPLTNADIGAYDFNNDEDVFIDLSGEILTLCGDTGCGQAELYINASTTYQPGGVLDVHDIEINGTFIATSTVYVGGSWDNNATSTLTGSTVIFSATTTSETIDSTGAYISSFNNVTFGSSTSAADWSLVTPIDVNGDMAVNEGTLARGTTSITIAGDLSTSANGSWTGVGTTTFDGTGTSNWSDAHVTPENVGDVVVDGSSKTISLTGNVAAESITIGADDILDSSASHYDITVYQDWVNNNTFVAREGEVFFAATSTNKLITAGGDAFYDLSFIGAAGSWSFAETNLSVTNDFTVSTGTVTMPTGTTTLAGSFDSVGGTFVHNNAALYLTSSAVETIAASGTAFTNNFYTLNFNGGGSWSFLDVNATTSNDLIIQQGTVTMPGGIMAIGSSLANTAGSFAHNNGTLQFTSAAAETIDTASSFNNLLFSGSGSWSFLDASLTAVGDVTVSGGTLTLPSDTLTLGGSLTNTATIAHNGGTVLFNSADAGEVINLGASSLYNMTFNNETGGWTIEAHATATNDFILATSSDFTLQTGETLAVGGVFQNAVGGASTTWGGTTLRLYSGATYAVNQKTDAGDVYSTLEIDPNTDVSFWNSSALTYIVDATGSLYSQDHASNDGELYVFGAYARTSGTEYWSYTTDFDGTDLSGGGERQAKVYFANGASAAISGSVLEALGTSTASTTVQNQGAGTYAVSVSGGTTTLQYYDFDDLAATGLSLLASTTVTSLADGAFTPAVGGGTALTVSSTTIDTNPGLQIYRVNFSTTTLIAATNVTQTDGVPTSYWWFRDSIGNIQGEAFDADPDAGGDPGPIRWDDSSLVITVSGVVYSDDGATTLGGPTCDGILTPVRVVVEGGSTYDGTCNGGTGAFSIGGVTVVGDPTLTVFLNGAAGGEQAVVVTKTPTADIADLDLYVNRVITRHEDVTALTIDDMAAYDNADDSDIPYLAATGTTDTLSVFADTELHVWATTTFTPGGPVTLNANATGNTYDGTLHIGEGATFTAAGTTTHTIGGSLVLENNATFIPASTTVLMTASTTGKTITTDSDETLLLNELQFTGIGGGWNLNANISATANVTVATGTVTGTGDITLTNGSFSGNGLVSLGGGTTTIYKTNTLGGIQGWAFYDLTLGNGAFVGTTTPASNATTTVDGRLTISTAHFLDAGASSWELGGTGTVFVEDGTFLYDTSTTHYSGTGATDILSTDYYNLVLDAFAGSPTYTGTGLGVQVFGDLIVGSTATTTVNFDTNDLALNIEGDLTIGTLGTFVASDTGSFTLAGSYDNNGVFTGSNGTITFDGSGTHTIAAGSSP